MILILKKNNLVLIGLILLLLVTIFSLNINADNAVTAANKQDIQKTVIVDPGHGGEDPGAVSDFNSIKEKDLNLKIALMLQEKLVNSGYKVLMTRDADRLEYTSDTKNIIQKRKQDLQRRKKMMDEAGADIVVSIHLNKFPESQYHGAQTFFPPNSANSQKLANNIQKSIRELVDPENKRESLVKKDQIIILKDFKTTTVIVECGFLSNSDEEKKLGNAVYEDQLAAAIKNGIDRYFGK